MAGHTLSEKERGKLAIIQSAIARNITNGSAAKQLGISIRQIQRLKAEVTKQGERALIHKLKGRASNHQLDPVFKEKVLQVVKTTYSDFKPTFASEKLEQHDNLLVHPQTLRRWMSKAELWKIRRKKQPEYFSWRPRKEYYGELEQFDGSYHYWFEDRYTDPQGNPLEVCLLAAIDDATGQITHAEFAEHEGVIPVFTFWKAYVQQEALGKPLGIYLDRFSTYKINHKAALDNKELKTQFQRAMQTLGVTVIFANSPQGKGRVEKLFGTLQDRLVKEMRLAGISTPEEGNRFLKEVFVKAFNRKFAVIPAKKGSVHKVLTTHEKKILNHIFCVHDTRRVNNDFTVQFTNTWYQLTELQPTTVRAKERILVETWLDGSIHFLSKGYELNTTVLPERPKKQCTQQPTILTTHPLNWKPPKDHPWRKFTLKKG